MNKILTVLLLGAFAVSAHAAPNQGVTTNPPPCLPAVPAKPCICMTTKPRMANTVHRSIRPV